MNKRKPSGINVKVLSFDPIVKACLDYIVKKREEKGQDTDIVGVNFGRPVGIVDTPKGVFCLTSEGIIGCDPLDNTDNKLCFEGYPEFPKVEQPDGSLKGSFAMFPEAVGTLTLDEVLELPVEKELPLEEFVESFGHRLESNYLGCVEVLEDAGVKVESVA